MATFGSRVGRLGSIRPAIVGGVISGGVVLLGVLLAEGLRHWSSRRNELQQATRTVVIRLPVAMVYLTATPPDESRLDVGSTGWTIYQEVVTSSVGGIDLLESVGLTASRVLQSQTHDNHGSAVSRVSTVGEA